MQAARDSMCRCDFEQYPQVSGYVPELRALAPDSARVAKVSFSCAADPVLLQRVKDAQRSVIVIAGLEAHVCVLQSALGFRQAGYQIVVVADAMSSRAPASRDIALQRLRENGVEVATTEMVCVRVARSGRYAGIQGTEQADQVISNRRAGHSCRGPAPGGSGAGINSW
jgi:nicotinamidase-related amidase